MPLRYRLWPREMAPASSGAWKCSLPKTRPPSVRKRISYSHMVATMPPSEGKALIWVQLAQIPPALLPAGQIADAPLDLGLLALALVDPVHHEVGVNLLAARASSPSTRRPAPGARYDVGLRPGLRRPRWAASLTAATVRAGAAELLHRQDDEGVLRIVVRHRQHRLGLVGAGLLQHRRCCWDRPPPGRTSPLASSGASRSMRVTGGRAGQFAPGVDRQRPFGR